MNVPKSFTWKVATESPLFSLQEQKTIILLNPLILQNETVGINGL